MTPASTGPNHALRRFLSFVAGLTIIVAAGLLLAPTAGVAAHGNGQSAGGWSRGSCDPTHHGWGSQARACQVRRTTFALTSGHLSLDTTNGGIDITGEDRPDVALEAKVQTWAGSEGEAQALLDQVAIDTADGDIRDHGPHAHLFENTGYSVDYRLHVPRHLAVDLHTMNGGIDLSRLDGDLKFHTTNGGVTLDRLSGKVDGETVNGGLTIELSGDRWNGSGLHADTTNGGVQLRIPENYSAHLETGTTNGGLTLNFPMTIQGTIRNRLDTNLGSGGATIHAYTVNGGVTIAHGGTPAAAD